MDTRSKGLDLEPLLGIATSLPVSQLPTKGDILRDVQFTRRLKQTTNNLPPYKNVEDTIVDGVINVWLKASIPQLITRQTIKEKLLLLFEKYKKAVKCYQSNRNPSFVTNFQSDINTLFDICKCKCKKISVISKEKMSCACPPEARILGKEIDFLFDQRGSRHIYIGFKVDSTTTKQYTKSQHNIIRTQLTAERNRYQSSDSTTQRDLFHLLVVPLY